MTLYLVHTERNMFMTLYLVHIERKHVYGTLFKAHRK